MGTAQEQGEIWGARAQDWYRCNEAAWVGIFSRVLDEAGVSAGSSYLDLGCGAGGALVLAHGRGAKVTGLDASAALVEIARSRLPEAEIAVGDMAALPFASESHDIVSGINSFQFTGDIARALGEAARVCRKGGTIAVLTWGRREDCDLLSGIMPAVFALLPPPPPADAPPPTPLGSPGVIETLLDAAGLTAPRSHDFSADLAFPDLATAVRGCMAASVRAIRHVGEERVAAGISAAMTRFIQSDGQVRLHNRFRLVTARR